MSESSSVAKCEDCEFWKHCVCVLDECAWNTRTKPTDEPAKPVGKLLDLINTIVEEERGYRCFGNITIETTKPESTLIASRKKVSAEPFPTIDFRQERFNNDDLTLFITNVIDLQSIITTQAERIEAQQVLIDSHSGVKAILQAKDKEDAEQIELIEKQCQENGKAAADRALEIDTLQAKIEKHRWIPVSEGLPKNGSCVFVTVSHMKERWGFLAWFDTSKEKWELYDNMVRGEVTHWKPITLPEEKPNE